MLPLLFAACSFFDTAPSEPAPAVLPGGAFTIVHGERGEGEIEPCG
jgi:hypothetical protein